jgi:hypothetical protein
MGLRTNPTYPVWDSNTVTTQVDKSGRTGAQTTSVAVPDQAYWVIFSAVDRTNASIYIGDNTGDDADTGIYLEADPPGPGNVSLACSPGTTFKVRHDADGIFNYTFFYNKL